MIRIVSSSDGFDFSIGSTSGGNYMRGYQLDGYTCEGKWYWKIEQNSMIHSGYHKNYSIQEKAQGIYRRKKHSQ